MSDLDVQIPTAFDPFAEANAGDSGAAAGSKDYVHVRIQQRNGRKSLTTVQGLKKEFSYSKILKDLKKEFCCNGTVVQDPELGQVIQLQGDQRKNVSNFLVQAGIVKKEHIKIHGFWATARTIASPACQAAIYPGWSISGCVKAGLRLATSLRVCLLPLPQILYEVPSFDGFPLYQNKFE